MPLDVAPVFRTYETQRTLNPPGIPALAPMPAGETDDTRRISERFGEDIVAGRPTQRQPGGIGGAGTTEGARHVFAQ